MADPPNRKKHPCTYVVQDRCNEAELHRWHVQDQVVNASMGEPLAEHPNPGSSQRILDVGGRTGGWLSAPAKSCAAATQQVGERVWFHARLDFPNNYFDLVNQCFGDSYPRTWGWPQRAPARL